MINLHGLNKLRAMGYTQEVEEIEAELTLLRAVVAWDQKYYPTLAGHAIGLTQSGETVAAGHWHRLCKDLRDALAAWRKGEEMARIEAVEERVRGLENQKRHLWKVYEVIRTRRDRLEAFGTEALAFPKPPKPQEPEPQL